MVHLRSQVCTVLMCSVAPKQGAEAESKEKHGGPYIGVDYNLTSCCRLQRVYHGMGNPMPESALSVRDLGFGLWMVHRRSVGCNVAQKSAAQLRRVQRSSVYEEQLSLFVFARWLAVCQLSRLGLYTSTRHPIEVLQPLHFNNFCFLLLRNADLYADYKSVEVIGKQIFWTKTFRNQLKILHFFLDRDGSKIVECTTTKLNIPA